MHSKDSCQIGTTLRSGSYVRLPFCKIKDSILGPGYNLSLVLIGDKKSRTLSREHRDKDAVSNVLAFPLTSTEGEIYINVRAADRKKGEYEMSSASSSVGYLFIHALLHLKGLRHGSTMESTEQRFCKRFHFS
jgi:rRNA maturation RNase YbeY